MKKTAILGMILILVTVLALPVSASAGTAYEVASVSPSESGTFANVWELFQHWEAVGYPDYVSGVWTEQGDTIPCPLVIGITPEGGDAARREVLDLVEDDGSVSFTTQTYSYNYLRQLQEEITAYLLENELGSWGIGVSVMENHIGLSLQYDVAEHETTALVVKALKERYGDIVQIETGRGPIVTYDEIIDVGSAVVTDTAVHPGKQLMMWLPVALVMLLVASGAILVARRRTAVMQTATGETVTTGEKLSAAQVEDKIREEAPAPSSELDRRVFSELDR